MLNPLNKILRLDTFLSFNNTELHGFDDQLVYWVPRSNAIFINVYWQVYTITNWRRKYKGEVIFLDFMKERKYRVKGSVWHFASDVTWCTTSLNQLINQEVTFTKSVSSSLRILVVPKTPINSTVLSYFICTLCVPVRGDGKEPKSKNRMRRSKPVIVGLNPFFLCRTSKLFSDLKRRFVYGLKSRRLMIDTL